MSIHYTISVARDGTTTAKMHQTSKVPWWRFWLKTERSSFQYRETFPSEQTARTFIRDQAIIRNSKAVEKVIRLEENGNEEIHGW